MGACAFFFPTITMWRRRTLAHTSTHTRIERTGTELFVNCLWTCLRARVIGWSSNCQLNDRSNPFIYRRFVWSTNPLNPEHLNHCCAIETAIIGLHKERSHSLGRRSVLVCKGISLWISNCVTTPMRVELSLGYVRTKNRPTLFHHTANTNRSESEKQNRTLSQRRRVCACDPHLITMFTDMMMCDSDLLTGTSRPCRLSCIPNASKVEFTDSLRTFVHFGVPRAPNPKAYHICTYFCDLFRNVGFRNLRLYCKNHVFLDWFDF